MRRTRFVVPASAGKRRHVAQASCLCLQAHRQDACATRGGFTLVELLITIAIISILVSMSMGAVFMAQESARFERSQALVAKLHNVIIDRWESYRTRRLILTVAGNPSSRLIGVRELMRLEMPDRYEDLVFTPTTVAVPGLRNTYIRRINNARLKYNAANGTSYANATAFIQNVLGDPNVNQHQSAECLYLLIAASMSADERAEFKDKEYADTNGNFMPEFVDAWSNPIHFLRWAPGFISDVHLQDPIDHHDPFDPYGLQMGLASANIKKNWPTLGTSPPEPSPFNSGSIQAWGFAIVPLIFSAGPDKEYGIRELMRATPEANAVLLAKDRDPYSRYDDGAGSYVWRGEGMLVSGDTVHYDNIHNHNPVGFGK